MNKRILLLISFTLLFNAAMAQLIGGEVFMQGNFIQVGMNGCGSFGTSNPPPAIGAAGMPYYNNMTGLGFVADSDANGWVDPVTGADDFCGDYFLPGSPVEGWGIEFTNGTTGAVSTYINSDAGAACQIPGSIIAYNPPAGVLGIQSAVWQGTVDGVQVTQTISFAMNDLYFVMTFEVCNLNSFPINNVHIGRNVDPDNDAAQYFDYTTTNTILAQASSDGFSQVQAISASGCEVSLFSSNSNTTASWGGFGTVTPSIYTYGDASHIIVEDSSTSCDCAISMAANWATVPPGGCVTTNMSYVLSAVPIFIYPPFCAGGYSIPPTTQANWLPGGTYDFALPPAPGITINGTTGVISGGIGGTTMTIMYTPPPPDAFLVSTSIVQVYFCCGSEQGTLVPPSTPAPLNFCVDYPATVPSIGVFSISGDNTTAPFTSSYILTTPDDSLIEVNSTGIFNNVAIGEYCVRSINYKSDDPDMPVGGITPINYPTLLSLYNACITVDNIEKLGVLCAELQYATCTPIIISDLVTAGVPTNLNLCNISNDTVNLFDLIAGEDTFGVWTETSTILSLGAFNPAQALFDPYNQPEGTYEFTYTVDAEFPCTQQQTTVSINISQAPSIASAGSDVNLCSLSGLQLNANLPLNGAGTWSVYNGPPGLVIDDATMNNSTFSVAQSGIYTLIWAIENSAQCPIAYDTVVLNIAEVPSVTFNIDSLVCVNDTITLNYIGNGNVVDAFTWNFDLPNYIAGNNDGPIDASWSTIGPKNITLSVLAGAGCYNDTTAVVQVVGTLVNTIEDTYIAYGSEIDLLTVCAPSLMPIVATWSPSLDLSCDSCLTTVASPLTETEYHITIVDTNGCVATDSVTISITLNREINIPNAFSPNGDGTNDVWLLICNSLSEIEASVYNRWGEKMWQTTDKNSMWDGTYKGKRVDPGVYVYVLNGTYVDGGKVNLKGNVTLIK
jgi:gliding motility-associated-like protein